MVDQVDRKVRRDTFFGHRHPKIAPPKCKEMGGHKGQTWSDGVQLCLDRATLCFLGCLIFNIRGRGFPV